MEERVVSSLSLLYQQNLGSYKPVSPITDLEEAHNVISNPAAFTRDTVALALTAVRQYVGNNQQSLVMFPKLIAHDLFMHLTSLLCTTCDRFVMAASRDLVVTLQQCLLSQDVEMEEPMCVVELLTSTFLHSIDGGREAGLVTAIEILTQTLSSIRKYAAHAATKRILNPILTLFADWCKVLARLQLSGLVCAAWLTCLSKVIKLSKLASCVHLVGLCRQQLTAEVVASLLAGGIPMLWRLYLRCCCLMLKYSGGTSGQEEVELSRCILIDLSQYLVENAPLHKVEQTEVDVTYLRSALHLVVLANVTLLRSSHGNDLKGDKALLLNLSSSCEVVCRRLAISHINSSLSTWFFHIFLEQDDSMAECLLSLLHFYSILASRHSTLLDDLNWLDPWKLFSSLVAQLSYDHSVLLDLLLSPETVFLQYFLSVLHHILSHWNRIAVNLVLDCDLEACSLPSGAGGAECSMLTLTSGFESLMAYNDDSVTSSDSSYLSEESCEGKEPNLQNVLSVLEKLSQLLLQMNEKKLTPFNAGPLTTLLVQVLSLARQSGRSVR